MTDSSLPLGAHAHAFHIDSTHAERGTRWVLWITLAAMLLEIAAGWWFNSMALLADGWHMGSHALAIGLTVAAYAAARRYMRDPRFAFGTWKIEVLAGFASAIALLGVAGLMAWVSVERLIAPQAIAYREAMAVAALGLAVNVVCALILARSKGSGHAHHHHGHDHHSHDHAQGHGHEDLNLKSAYLHVMADALTSVLAIVALAGGWLFGWNWLDPAMGLVGVVLVAWWARGLLRQTASVLLDREMDHPVVAEIRDVVEADGRTRITDLHVWRVGREVYACAIALVTNDPTLTPQTVRARLAVHEEVVHSTIEVHRVAPDQGASCDR